LLAPSESSEELKKCVRKMKEAGLIPERDERTIKQVKKGGKKQTMWGSAPLTSKIL